MSSEEGSNIIIPIALAAPHILTMTMSFTLWTLKELGNLCPAAADHFLCFEIRKSRKLFDVCSSHKSV